MNKGKRASTADNGSEWICCSRTAASVIAHSIRNIAMVGDMLRLVIFGNLAIRSPEGCNFRFRKPADFRDSYRVARLVCNVDHLDFLETGNSSRQKLIFCTGKSIKTHLTGTIK